MTDTLHIIWFKRDLRHVDHEPLYEAVRTAIESGDKILPLYILEPELWQQPDMSHRHYAFLCECLLSLKQDLNGRLIVRVGEAVSVLEALHQEYKHIQLWSHQESWNGWTYKRDIAVGKWAKDHNMTWHEYSNFGVVRRLKSRDDWADAWHKIMLRPIIAEPPEFHMIDIVSDALPASHKLGLTDDGCIWRQKGGRKEGLQMLDSFLNLRGEHYTKDMSSPVTAFEACSRISPYLSFGCVSMREVFQIASQREADIKNMPYQMRGKWGSALRSFLGRLRWHCHFIQKLEDAPQIEFQNMHPLYDGLRENDFNIEFFEAWKSGKTGYPMIDSAMRALIQTGWINFRMRAMLMSFASYHLWLHWRQTSLYLARLFVDYEPGIHYSQAQMQSGTTGINAIRIYNPIKQGIDQDPEGIFIRKWLPELKDMPQDALHAPWKHHSLMGEYPMPIINEKTARKMAADKIYSLRKQEGHRDGAKKVYEKHGSRKKATQKKRAKKSEEKPSPKQGELPF
ncbi:MAG: FAD-binding domain-containing protein [Pseudomonadota bacterium]